MFTARRSLIAAGMGLALSLGLSACQPPNAEKEKEQASSDHQPVVTSPNGSVSAPQAGPKPVDSIEGASRQLFGGQTPSLVRDSPIPGLKEVFVANNVYYASPDGKYFLQGDMINVATRQSETESARSVVRVETMKEMDVKDSITFKATGKQKHEVYVFTDSDCGYCRKLHSEIKQYNANGITVHYFPWPRSGNQGPTYETMVSVWCAKNKQQALTDAKDGKPVPKATCDNPVQKYLDIGHKMMVNGTPAIFSLDGQQLGGYVPPTELLQKLDAAKAK